MEKYLIYIPILLYVISLFSNAYRPGVKGFYCLLFGWMGLISFKWNYGLPWLANILIIIAYSPWLNDLWALILSSLAVAFSLLALSVKKVPKDEAGNYMDVKPGIGLFVWIGALVSVLIQSIMSVV